MKNTIELVHQLTCTKITFCYGNKAYSKYMKEQFNEDDFISGHGRCTTAVSSTEFRLVIGVRKIKDIYSLKSMVIHELSHAVTELMDEYNFNCDEFRSYTLQWLYCEIMPSLDAKIEKDSKNGR